VYIFLYDLTSPKNVTKFGLNVVDLWMLTMFLRLVVPQQCAVVLVGFTDKQWL
jgi:hypothetical protein